MQKYKMDDKSNPPPVAPSAKKLSGSAGLVQGCGGIFFLLLLRLFFCRSLDHSRAGQ
eukprot:COSAG01_NODE_15894_length_1287_cov_3.191919_1_plen_56_part_10